MDISSLFLYLDPFQMILLISSIVAFILCTRSFIKTSSKRFRLMMGFLIGFNFWVIARYVLLLIFKMDSHVLSSNETAIINIISQATQIYMAGIAIFSSIFVYRDEKKMLRKWGINA
jgi:hypothetical protein